MSDYEYIGTCAACGGQILRYEAEECPLCGETVHRGCLVKCAGCGEKGCRSCMLNDDETGEYFCDTTGPEDCQKPKAERVKISECYLDFKEKENVSTGSVFSGGQRSE